MEAILSARVRDLSEKRLRPMPLVVHAVGARESMPFRGWSLVPNVSSTLRQSVPCDDQIETLGASNWPP